MQSYIKTKDKIENFYRKTKQFYNVDIEFFVDDKDKEYILQISFFEKEKCSLSSKKLINIYIKSQCIEKFNVLCKYDKFSNAELKFFDCCDFKICTDSSRNTEQKIEDWFSSKDLNNISIPISKENNYLNLFVSKDSNNKIGFKEWFKKILIATDNELQLNRIISSHTKYHMKDIDYVPSKQTVLSMIIGCGLNIDEANELCHKTGYHLSNYIEYDKIIIKAIQDELDLDETNQKLLDITNDKYSTNSIKHYLYRNKLLGSPKTKKCALLQVEKASLSIKEYKDRAYKNGCI